MQTRTHIEREGKRPLELTSEERAEILWKRARITNGAIGNRPSLRKHYQFPEEAYQEGNVETINPEDYHSLNPYFAGQHNFPHNPAARPNPFDGQNRQFSKGNYQGGEGGGPGTTNQRNYSKNYSSNPSPDTQQNSHRPSVGYPNHFGGQPYGNGWPPEQGSDGNGWNVYPSQQQQQQQQNPTKGFGFVPNNSLRETISSSPFGRKYPIPKKGDLPFDTYRKEVTTSFAPPLPQSMPHPPPTPSFYPKGRGNKGEPTNHRGSDILTAKGDKLENKLNELAFYFNGSPGFKDSLREYIQSPFPLQDEEQVLDLKTNQLLPREMVDTRWNNKKSRQWQ